MTIYLGDFAAGETIYIPFHTFNSSGASVTITGLAVTDIEIYKDGGVTQRASDAGYTLLDTDGIDFDGITGIHGFSIATSDNTDAGFYVAGSDYWVVVSAITVDAQTVNFVSAIFSIENRSALRPTTAGRTLDVASTGEAGLDFANVNIPAGQVPIAQILDNGTMQAGSTSSTAVLRSGFSAGADDRVIGATIWISGGTGAGQRSTVYDSVDATDTVSVTPSWGTTPDNTSTYILYPTPPAPTNSAALPAVNMTALGGDAQSATDLKDFADAGYDPATNKVQGVVLTDTVTTYTGNTVQTGDIGVAGAGLTAIPWNASWDAEVQSEVADALAVYDGPTNAEMEARTIVSANYATAASLATVDGIVDTLVSGVITGAAATGTLSTTQATTNLTGYANDQLIGRVIIWLTGNCEGEASDLTDYASASGLLTFTALTTAPGNGDTFKIV